MIVLATKFTGHDLASVMKTLKSHFSMNNKNTANNTSDPANLYLFKWPETSAERNIRMMLVEENHRKAFRQYQNKFIIMIAEVWIWFICCNRFAHSVRFSHWRPIAEQIGRPICLLSKSDEWADWLQHIHDSMGRNWVRRFLLVLWTKP